MNNLKELLAQFLENPSRELLRELFRNEYGEFNNIEFKSNFTEYSKIAKHIIAIANSGGGIIIFGIEENEKNEVIVKGLEFFTDKTDISKNIKKYLPQQLKFDLLNFDYKESEYNIIKGKKFQVVIIEQQYEYAPFISLKDGIGIRINSIYVRNNINSEEANYNSLQEILNKRIQTGYLNNSEIELAEHLQQVKELYSQLNKYNYEGGIYSLSKISESFYSKKTLNKSFPKESYEDFILRLLEIKKAKIESLLIK